MSTTLAPPPSPVPDAAPARSKILRRVLVAVLVLAGVSLVFVGLLILSWMIDETHFDRPSAAFDDLEAQIASLPTVEGVDKERWVEAPTFSSPTSWMSVTVGEAGLAALLDAACSTEYPDPVTWSVRVVTPTAAEVSLHATSFPATAVGCPDFGFDAEPLVAEIDRVAPGIHVQPSTWDDSRFALVALDDGMPAGYAHLLPLVEHADELLAAAGLDAARAVEINSMNLGMILPQGESADYLALLSELADEHEVTSFWADGDGAQVDGIDKVQIVAPESEHAAIERAIRSSSLHIADLPVRFIEQ